MIQVKRVYDSPAESDGERILVDRLWPRGLEKKAVQLRNLAQMARWGPVTLVYAAKDSEHNNALVLKNLLEQLLREDDEAVKSP